MLASFLLGETRVLSMGCSKPPVRENVLRCGRNLCRDGKSTNRIPMRQIPTYPYGMLLIITPFHLTICYGCSIMRGYPPLVKQHL